MEEGPCHRGRGRRGPQERHRDSHEQAFTVTYQVDTVHLRGPLKLETEMQLHANACGTLPLTPFSTDM